MAWNKWNKQCLHRNDCSNFIPSAFLTSFPFAFTESTFSSSIERGTAWTVFPSFFSFSFSVSFQCTKYQIAITLRIRIIWTKTTNRLHSAAPSKMDRAHSMTRCPFTKTKRSKHSTLSLTVSVTADIDAIFCDISIWWNLTEFQCKTIWKAESECDRNRNGQLEWDWRLR